MNAKVIEWSGAILGLTGSLLLALNVDISGYGFVAFLISNVCWLAFGIKNRAWGLVTMQAGYSVTSLMGLYNWFIKPASLVITVT
ncbi:hypothetical protein [Burkholderia ubonensis]|uniref:hypothetical protein n=1 Tax=Burkholderia ubonensis TaxID=101571 RepID=UPI000754715C|nr:hypothetical protein [Burkholderia ubonensis]KVP17325.1 hypothetical protein WJ84_03590 [Burkholderia ubonensis]KVP39555.1 hypothetical protein WJ87_04780 [Burkholderia ubonensis]